MSLAVLVVVAAAAVAARVGLRLRQRRRRTGGNGADAGGAGPGPAAPGPAVARGAAGVPAGGPGAHVRPAAVALVAGREMRQRSRSRVFRIGTGVLVAAVVVGVVLPVALKSTPTRQRVGVVGPLSPDLQVAVRIAAARAGVGVRLLAEPTVAAADGAVRAGRLDLAIVDGRRLVVKNPLTASDTSATAQLTREVAVGLSLAEGLLAAGLSPLDTLRLANPAPLPVTSLVPTPHRPVPIGTAVIVLVLLYVLLSQYGQWIVLGVVEEKASRVVEVLLAALRPMQLLAGKVLGIGAMALAQGLLLVAAALVAATAVGSSLVHGANLGELLSGLLWLVLGYGFYCGVYAGAGSLVERLEDVQTIAFPMQLPMLVGYLVCLINVGDASPSLLVRVLAFLPPTAPFAMPLLVAQGAATWWEVVLAAGATVVATVGVMRVAAGVFRRAILKTGTRVRLRDLRAG